MFFRIKVLDAKCSIMFSFFSSSFYSWSWFFFSSHHLIVSPNIIFTSLLLLFLLLFHHAFTVVHVQFLILNFLYSLLFCSYLISFSELFSLFLYFFSLIITPIPALFFIHSSVVIFFLPSAYPGEMILVYFSEGLHVLQGLFYHLFWLLSQYLSTFLIPFLIIHFIPYLSFFDLMFT